MATPHERLMQLRELARRLESSPPSRERDELLVRTRLRIVEIEAPEDLDPPASIPPQENVEIARRGYDAFNRGDFEAMVEDFAPDCEYVTAAVITGVRSVYRGPDGYRRCIEGLFGDYDDARVEVHDLIEAEDRVLVSMTARGRGKQRGVETSWSVFQVWTLRDGKISRGQKYTRRDEALEAVGLRE